MTLQRKFCITFTWLCRGNLTCIRKEKYHQANEILTFCLRTRELWVTNRAWYKNNRDIRLKLTTHIHCKHMVFHYKKKGFGDPRQPSQNTEDSSHNNICDEF